MADAHNLGDDGQAGSFLGFFEELEALCLKAPSRALCDGAQSLTPDQFDVLAKKVQKVAETVKSL